MEEVGQESDGVTYDITDSTSRLLNDYPSIDQNVGTEDDQAQTNDDGFHGEKGNKTEESTEAGPEGNHATNSNGNGGQEQHARGGKESSDGKDAKEERREDERFIYQSVVDGNVVVRAKGSLKRKLDPTSNIHTYSVSCELTLVKPAHKANAMNMA